MHKDQFYSVLAEFGEMTKADLEPDEETGFTSFTLDGEYVMNLKYLEASDAVLLFSPVGKFGGVDAPDAGEKALALLKLCDLSGPALNVTFSLDEDADLVLATRCMSGYAISSADALAVLLQLMVDAVKTAREYFIEHFPVKEA